MHNSFKYINLSWAVVAICERLQVGDSTVSWMAFHDSL
jgi:hypothetical protein